MSDSQLRAQVQQAVQEAVGDAVEHHLDSLRAQLVDEICSRLDGLAAPSLPGVSSAPVLSAALKSIQEGATQADILAALLQSTESFAPRAALLVLRGGSILAWRSRGFFAREPKGAILDSSRPLLSRALSQRAAASGPASEFDSAFLAGVGAPAGHIFLVPLLVRDKVAALLYADAGLASGGSAAAVDAAALDCLVRFAGAWVELAGLRKSGLSPGADVAEPAHPPAPAHSSDFEAEQPLVAGGVEHASALDPFAPVHSAASPGVPARPPASMDQGELHKKARRFAKLLVDEIQLYNREKVEQGRRNADLYSRLKLEIEKSRAAYDKRYGQSLGDPTDYFREELVRILANNNPALLGSEDPS